MLSNRLQFPDNYRAVLAHRDETKHDPGSKGTQQQVKAAEGDEAAVVAITELLRGPRPRWLDCASAPSSGADTAPAEPADGYRALPDNQDRPSRRALPGPR
jgi:hypothetical protein